MPPFVRRERKHKRLARRPNDDGHHSNATDTNVNEIIPASQKERQAGREELKQQLRDQQPESKISSQKRKRLEKYVETKLRKEENAELVRKLAAQVVDTSLLRSSKNLGRAHESQRETLQRALKECDLLGIQHEAVLYEPRQQTPDEVPPANVIAPSLGSGLKRPLETDENGRPVIRKRKRRKRNLSRTSEELQDDEPPESDANGSLNLEEEVDEEWQGFSDSEEDSADTAIDTSSDTSEDEDTDIQSLASQSDEDISNEKPARISAFKAWATAQQNAAIGFNPSSAPVNDVVNPAVKANFKPRALSPDPLLNFLVTSEATQPASATSAVTISRSHEVQKGRLELPVVQEEQKIIETINSHPTTIICGATGSGKTTQVPQMLFENGYGSLIGSSIITKDLRNKRMIGITQPRRVAATSVADRVAREMGPAHSQRVAYQVRYDTSVSRDTAIKFMTDGILLREIQVDFVLEKYSCIIVDEAHERSVNTDVLIGLLSRIVPLRKELTAEQPERFCPLRVVIMSATLRVDDFVQNERLFPQDKPPIVDVEGRQYVVTEHFARKTKRDYVNEMVEKVARGHRKLPPGGILAFLTGQEEISTVAKMLKERLGESNDGLRTDHHPVQSTDEFDEDDLENAALTRGSEIEEDNMDEADSEIEVTLGEEPEEFAIEDDSSNMSTHKSPLKPQILALYAALPASQQLKVFQPPPEGHRVIILATNVAETSLTIPGIRYVFDSGRSKERRHDQATGVQTFAVDWVSKASAAQRKGRAGRTGPGGHVWRLYSSAVYEQYFSEYTMPEILRTPLESVILQVKGFGIENAADFPFPTAPERVQLMKAEVLLKNLGAITGDGISDSGKEMSAFPVSPRLGKMLLLARNNHMMQHAVALVAGLAIGELYLPEAQPNQDAQAETTSADPQEKQHQAYTRAQAQLSKWDSESDAIKVLNAIAAHADAQSKSVGDANKFCKEFWLREKGMQEVQQLRAQLYSAVKLQNNTNIAKFTASLTHPAEKECKMLNQIVAASFIDQVAMRADMLKDGASSFGRKPKRAIEVAYRTLLPTISDIDIDRGATAVEQETQKSVFIHPSSVLAKLTPKDMPQYIVYSHLSKATPSTIDGKEKRIRIHPLTPIGPKALAMLAEGTPMLDYGKPIGKIEELPNRRRQCWVNVSLRAPEIGGMGWPLSAWKVVQKKTARGDWEVEKVIAR